MPAQQASAATREQTGTPYRSDSLSLCAELCLCANGHSIRKTGGRRYLVGRFNGIPSRHGPKQIFGISPQHVVEPGRVIGGFATTDEIHPPADNGSLQP